MAKGGSYERELCKTLSLWLSDDISDDHLWRSSNSGGRATVRARKGMSTKEHIGDMSATSKLGRQFLKVFTIEIKRGYNKCSNVTLSDMLDSPPKRKVNTLLDWIKQVERGQKLSKTPHWMIVHRRDNRRAVVYCNVQAYHLLHKVDNNIRGGIVFIKRNFAVLPLTSLLKLDITKFKTVFFL